MIGKDEKAKDKMESNVDLKKNMSKPERPSKKPSVKKEQKTTAVYYRLYKPQAAKAEPE